MTQSVLFAIVLASCAVRPGTVGAQGAPGAGERVPGRHPGAAGESRTVRGRIVRGGESSARPLAGAWVVLHRVGTDHAGPLDSVRTDAGGGYAFRYRTSGDSGALYFVSGTDGGIAYFTPPLLARRVEGEAAELVTFDTSSAPVPIRVRARHLVVSAPDSNRLRTVVEIFELSNDSSVTRVARGDAGVVWESGLLDGARDARVGQADFSPEAVRFGNGRVRVVGPFAPGLKQISFSYVVPAAGEYSLLVTAPAAVLEVLVEDSLGRAEGAGIAAAGPALVSERTFARFLGQDIPANTVVRVFAPTRGRAADNQVRVLIIVAALATVLLVGFARGMLRRPPGAAAPAVAADVADLRARLAALDEAYGSIEQPTADQRADHWQERAHLSQQLTTALAREQGLA